MSRPLLQLMAAGQKEQQSGQNLDCSVEACDQQELMATPIIDNLLTQDIIDNNDDIHNGESVLGSLCENFICVH